MEMYRLVAHILLAATWTETEQHLALQAPQWKSVGSSL